MPSFYAISLNTWRPCRFDRRRAATPGTHPALKLGVPTTPIHEEEPMPTKPVVLVVDDEPEMTSLAMELLADAGCCVIPANGGEEAVRILQDRRVDVLLTDMRMPRPDCWDLLEELRRTNATTETVVMTGCGTEILHREAELRGAAAVLQKPFTGRQLVGAVNHAADRVYRAEAAHV